MSGDERGTGPQATSNFLKGAKPLLPLDEVQGQDAGRAIKRTFRCTVDKPLVQSCTDDEVTEGLSRKIEHGSCRINSDERPPRLTFGKHLKLEATASAENEQSGVSRSTLFQEKHGHALHVGIAGHHARWIFSVACDGLRVRKGVHASQIIMLPKRLRTPDQMQAFGHSV